MPPRLTAPVLSVDVGKLHQVDTRNAENLYNMWSVFSNCAAVLEEGPRYEYFCWRLWNRETFCCEPSSEANATTPAISNSCRSSEGLYTDVPSLSGSCDSLEDEEAIDFDLDASADMETPRIRRPSSLDSRSRGREKHITPDDLEKMVMTIKEAKPLEPLHLTITPIPELSPEAVDITPVGPTPITSTPPTDSIPSSSEVSLNPASSDSLPFEHSVTNIVRGFSPSLISSSLHSAPRPATPSSIANADLAALPTTTTKHAAPKKPSTKFALGGSSGEDSLSEQTCMEAKPKKKQPTKFSFGGSSNEDDSSLSQRAKSKSNASDPAPKPMPQPKSLPVKSAQRSHQEEEQMFDDEVCVTDEDESAIDEDDSSEWEDSVEDSGNVSIDERLSFPRVDSRHNLSSRRSLITAQLHQSDRAQALINAATRSTPAMQHMQRSSRHSSPNGPSLAASPADEAPLMMKGLKSISEVPRSNPQPIIMTTTNVTPHQALSPKTTRRNMMSQELPPSLRQHLLNERQQKVANAVFTRRHTSHDVANLKQYPEKVHFDKDDREGLNSSWNQYFGHGLGEYHSKGW